MAASRRLAAVMFTDIAGCTTLAQRDETAALTLQREQEELVRPLLAGHGGRRVRPTGDGLLVEFESAPETARCAVEIQRRLHERNAEKGSASPDPAAAGSDDGAALPRGRPIRALARRSS